jgi:large subunit ribosomal protein L22
MEARAIARFVRVAPTKADRVLRQIRGLPVERAQEILAYSLRPVAKKVSKVLASAVANATHREEAAALDRLYVKHAVADSGPSLKRIQPRAQGRAYQVLVRMSHITIIVAERQPKASAAAPEAPAREEKAAPKRRISLRRPAARKAQPEAKAKTKTKAAPKRKAGAGAERPAKKKAKTS